MAEPVFKLLRCDAEASHMLGWAKKEVRRLVDFAHLDAFNRTWKFGDVSVRAQYFGGVARLWLEAEAAERIALGVKLPDPYPFRVLFNTSMTLGSPSITTSTTITPVEWGLKIVEHYVMRDSFGAIVKEWDGIQEPSYSAGKRALTFTSWLKVGGGSAYVYQGLPVTVFTFSEGAIWYEVSGTVVEGISTAVYASPTDPAYSTLVHELNESAVVVTSDARVLAVSPVQTVGGVTTYFHQAFSPYCVAAFVEDASDPGSGTTYTFSHMLDIGPIDADLVDAFVQADDVFPPYYFDNGRETVESAWYAYRDAAVARRKALFKQHTEDMIAGLKAGDPLPPSWDYWIKSNAPYSVHVRRSIPITYAYVDAFPTANLTVRTATFSYSYTDAEGNTEVVSETVVGQKELIYTDHYYALGDGGFAGQSRKEIYSNWFIPPGDTGPTFVEETNQHVPHAFIADGSRQFEWSTAKGMGLFWSGELTSIYFGADYYPDSTVLYPVTPPRLDVTPMPPPYRNTLVAYAPEFLYTWHRRSTQKYDSGYTSSRADRALVSAALQPGATVTIIPFAKVKNGDLYGAFNARRSNVPTAIDDAEGADELEIYGAAVYSYAQTGGFQFSRWVALPNGAESARMAKPEGDWPEYNAVVIYGNEKWDDVKEEARAQRKALADPNDPAHDPFMKAVLDALTPQE